MQQELLQGFYLGDFLVQPLTGQVTGKDGATHLPPKAVETLLCLAANPGELVSRETLLTEGWGKGKGSQEALSHTISEIRHAFDDHHDDPHFIQTLPRRGYRLLVTPVLASAHTDSVVMSGGESTGLHHIGLFENLQRRGVLETVIAYLVLGWLLIQVADIVFERLLLPDWTVTFITVLVIAGFPVAIALSWFLDVREGRAVLSDLSPAAKQRRRFGRTYMSVIGAFAIAGVGVYIYDATVGLPKIAEPLPLVSEPRYEPPPIVENSFAVLPFMNIDGSDETRIFANGLVEDVITQLSRVPGLRVAARGDSFSLAANSSSKDVRDRLRVEQYLEGSVELAGNEMRVTVQMIDSATGFHVLGRTFTGLREDFFKVRDEVTSLTVANIRVALPPGVRASALKVTEDPSLNAYVLYRRGIEETRKPQTIDTVSAALGWFDAALNVDPEYAAAYAGKCDVLTSGYKDVDDPSFIDRAEQSCARALELNANLDIVHTALGNLYNSTGRQDAAEAAYLKALAIDPANVAALTNLGSIYADQQRFEEAEASFRRAVNIHPGDAQTYNRLGVFLFRTGRYREAAQQYQYMVALQPDNMHGYANLGGSLMLAGDFANAALAYQKAINIQPTATGLSNLGLMHYYLGNYDAAIENLGAAVELQPNDYLAKSNLGDALWVAGSTSEAKAEFALAETLALGAYNVNPSDPLTMMDLAWIKAMLGKHAEARELIDRALNLAPDDPYSHYYDAMVHLQAGNKSQALAALQVAVSKGYSKQMLKAEPHLSSIRNDSRFITIVDSS